MAASAHPDMITEAVNYSIYFGDVVLVRFYLRDVTVLGAWSGPVDLKLHPHALAPIANLPVKRVIGARHVIANLTLDIGKVVFDYLAFAQASCTARKSNDYGFELALYCGL
jgi:acetoacetate decarboxylase